MNFCQNLREELITNESPLVIISQLKKLNFSKDRREFEKCFQKSCCYESSDRHVFFFYQVDETSHFWRRYESTRSMLFSFFEIENSLTFFPSFAHVRWDSVKKLSEEKIESKAEIEAFANKIYTYSWRWRAQKNAPTMASCQKIENWNSEAKKTPFCNGEFPISSLYVGNFQVKYSLDNFRNLWNEYCELFMEIRNCSWFRYKMKN